MLTNWRLHHTISAGAIWGFTVLYEVREVAALANPAFAGRQAHSYII
ncbi:MAG: hypothetical protein KF725_13755 [Cyclobacteriaceae bacterium]|nr:hypothetical protein [Cyclobacteriaceae bacterium]UYN85315.1 MAG: hypothetical protein KIT51_10455 [Cyclobacteriaceae bacterium]